MTSDYDRAVERLRRGSEVPKEEPLHPEWKSMDDAVSEAGWELPSSVRSFSYSGIAKCNCGGEVEKRATRFASAHKCSNCGIELMHVSDDKELPYVDKNTLACERRTWKVVYPEVDEAPNHHDLQGLQGTFVGSSVPPTSVTVEHLEKMHSGLIAEVRARADKEALEMMLNPKPFPKPDYLKVDPLVQPLIAFDPAFGSQYTHNYTVDYAFLNGDPYVPPFKNSKASVKEYQESQHQWQANYADSNVRLLRAPLQEEGGWQLPKQLTLEIFWELTAKCVNRVGSLYGATPEFLGVSFYIPEECCNVSLQLPHFVLEPTEEPLPKKVKAVDVEGMVYNALLDEWRWV